MEKKTSKTPCKKSKTHIEPSDVSNKVNSSVANVLNEQNDLVTFAYNHKLMVEKEKNNFGELLKETVDHFFNTWNHGHPTENVTQFRTDGPDIPAVFNTVQDSLQKILNKNGAIPKGAGPSKSGKPRSNKKAKKVDKPKPGSNKSDLEEINNFLDECMKFNVFEEPDDPQPDIAKEADPMSTFKFHMGELQNSINQVSSSDQYVAKAKSGRVKENSVDDFIESMNIEGRKNVAPKNDSPKRDCFSEDYFLDMLDFSRSASRLFTVYQSNNETIEQNNKSIDITLNKKSTDKKLNKNRKQSNKIDTSTGIIRWFPRPDEVSGGINIVSNSNLQTTYEQNNEKCMHATSTLNMTVQNLLHNLFPISELDRLHGTPFVFANHVSHAGLKKVRIWCGHSNERKIYDNCNFSKKVFLGNILYNISEKSLLDVLTQCGNVEIKWPKCDNSNVHNKGFAYAIFEEKSSIPKLLSNCTYEDGHYFMKIKLPGNYEKTIETIPWCINNSIYTTSSTPAIPNKSRTLFVSRVHGAIDAKLLYDIMEDLFGGIDVVIMNSDNLSYPTGCAYVLFNSNENFLRALAFTHIQIKTSWVNKLIQMDPYLCNSPCVKCGVIATFFCRARVCLTYFCENCWAIHHDECPGHICLTMKPVGRLLFSS